MKEDGDFAKYSDDSDVPEMDKQPVENDQWDNPYQLVDDDDLSKKEKDEGDKETESSYSSDSDLSMDIDDSEEKMSDSAQPEDDMAEQMKSLVGERGD